MKTLLSVEIVELSQMNIEAIVGDETGSFPPALRASRTLIERRFDLGHIMLGVMVNGKLAGKICFSYSHFSLDNRTGFPQTFREFSTKPMESDYNAAFAYNINVQPEYRRYGCARKLIMAMLSRIKLDGGSYVVLDGRPASYAGDEVEETEQKPQVKAAIDRHLAGGRFPTDCELCVDPMLAFYYRLGGRFLWIIRDFIPSDTATGGLRVIMYKEVV